MEILTLAIGGLVVGYGFRYGHKLSDTTDEMIIDICTGIAGAVRKARDRKPWEPEKGTE